MCSVLQLIESENGNAHAGMLENGDIQITQDNRILNVVFKHGFLCYLKDAKEFEQKLEALPSKIVCVYLTKANPGYDYKHKVVFILAILFVHAMLEMLMFLI